MDTRAVTATIKYPDGTLATGVVCTFDIIAGTYTVDDVIPPRSVSVTTHATLGTFSQELYCPATYRFSIADYPRETRKITVPAGTSDIPLTSLFASAASTATGDTIQIAIDARLALLDLDDLADVDAATPTDGDVLTYTAGEWIASTPASGSVSAHSELAGLDYASSAHTGFASSTQLTAETSERTAADTALQSDINTRATATALTTEVTTRASADTVLQTDINTRATTSALTAHTSDTANPHNVTTTQIGAATTAALTSEITNRTNADTVLQADINTRATASALTTHTADTANPHNTTAAQVGALTQTSADTRYMLQSGMAAYAQLAAAQTFTATQTMKGASGTEATAIWKVTDSSNNTILLVKKSSGYGVARLELTASGTANEPAFSITAMPQGLGLNYSYGVGGTRQFFQDGNGILELLTNHVRAWRVSASAYSTAGSPSFLFQEQSRSAVDHMVLFPSAVTSKMLAFRRVTSTGDAIAGRIDVAWSDTTHATRTSAGSLTLIKSATEVTPLAYDTQDSATQTGILILHNGTQKRVKIGAADSGGAGYRALIIDN